MMRCKNGKAVRLWLLCPDAKLYFYLHANPSKQGEDYQVIGSELQVF